MAEKKKKRLDKGKLFTRIIAGFMAGAMILAGCYTLIYCIQLMFA